MQDGHATLTGRKRLLQKGRNARTEMSPARRGRLMEARLAGRPAPRRPGISASALGPGGAPDSLRPRHRWPCLTPPFPRSRPIRGALLRPAPAVTQPGPGGSHPSSQEPGGAVSTSHLLPTPHPHPLRLPFRTGVVFLRESPQGLPPSLTGSTSA